MFGFKWPGKRLSDDEIRTLLASLVSTGCLLIAKTTGHINAQQNYYLLRALYHWLDIQDGDEQHNKEIGYRLTDQLVMIPDYAENPSVEYLFNKGKQLDNELRVLVIQLCITFALLGYSNQDKAMGLIGHFARDIGLSLDAVESLMPECIEDANTYSILGMSSEGYGESLRLLQQALKRATTKQ